jgi:hypothetical protein
VTGFARFSLPVALIAIFFLGFLFGKRDGSTVAAESAASHVRDNAALARTATGVHPDGLWRIDYAAGNAAPPLFFAPLSGTCTANRLTNDGGSCVDAGDGNSWKASFPSEIDWRQFGVATAASNNQLTAQAAFNAAYTLGLPLKLCGAGTFPITGTVYYYPRMHISWCPGTVLQKNAAGFAALSPASEIGGTYPVLGGGFYRGSIVNVTFERPTIDLTLTSGTGIEMSAVVDSKVVDPNIYNIAPKGTWSYIDAEGTGTLPNAGIVMAGGNVNNVENVEIVGGMIGNANSYVWAPPYNYTGCAHLGGAGIAMTVPSQDTTYVNPPNGNIIRNVALLCNSIGIQDDYGSDNRFIANDVSFSEAAGITNGTYGHYDLMAGGSVSAVGGDRLTVTFMSDGLVGSPISITYTTRTGDTLAEAAASEAAMITANPTLRAYGVSASVPAGTSNMVISYSEPNPLGFALAGSGAITLSAAHTTGRNFMSQTQAEGNRTSAIFIGPNVWKYIIDNPGSYFGTPLLVAHHHAGPNGSQTPIVQNAYEAQRRGTFKTASFTADCVNDIQPYLVSTAQGPITVSLSGSIEWGTVCQFVDYTGSWGARNLTIDVPSAAWGAVTIQGAASQKFAVSYGNVTLLNNQGTWIGAPPVER